MHEREVLMQVSRHYSRAPITEAIIDLKVTLPEGFSVDDLENIYAHINAHFPIKEQIHAGSLLFHSGPRIKIDASRMHHGFLFTREAGLRNFQVILSVLTVIRF